MTPRQMSGWLELAERRKMSERINLLAMLRGAQADQKAFRAMLKKLQDEAR